MRKLIATVFNYSLDGFLADEAPPPATGSSSCSTGGTANPAIRPDDSAAMKSAPRCGRYEEDHRARMEDP